MVRQSQVLDEDGQTMSRMSRRWLPGKRAGLLVLGLVMLAALGLIGSASAQSGPESMTPGALWIERFCYTPGQCIMGDFNGDGLDDIAVFFHSNSLTIDNTTGKAGDVWVALSNWNSFGDPQLWKQNFCVPNNRVCKVGDFNGDNLDDIIEFERASASSSTSRVWVALSNGYTFGDSTTPWKSRFCLSNEVCDVGDYDGDGRDDITAFTRSVYSDVGLVWVGRSNGVNGFGSGEQWTSFFCIQQEMCGSGDFNGDGKDDIIAFRKWGSSNVGPVYVATSTGHSFDKGRSWRDFFCPGWEVCGVADFNGDGKDDIISYLRSTYASDSDPKIGYVYVGLSNGSSFPKDPPWNSLWDTNFCTGQGSTGQICGSGNYIDGIGAGQYASYSQVSRTGDYNGDGRYDAIRFVRSTNPNSEPGYVYVAPSNGSGFVDTVPPPRGAWVLSLVTRLTPALQGAEATEAQPPEVQPPEVQPQ